MTGMIKDEQIATQQLSGKRHHYIVTTVLAFSLVVAAAFGSLIRPVGSVAASVTAPTMETARVVITIEGMICTSCANSIKAALKRTPGVISADVSFERREAIVEYDSDQTSRDKIIEAITKLGFKAKVKE